VILPPLVFPGFNIVFFVQLLIVNAAAKVTMLSEHKVCCERYLLSMSDNCKTSFQNCIKNDILLLDCNQFGTKTVEGATTLSLMTLSLLIFSLTSLSIKGFICDRQHKGVYM
jgi:hypothetical protein